MILLKKREAFLVPYLGVVLLLVCIILLSACGGEDGDDNEVGNSNAIISSFTVNTKNIDLGSSVNLTSVFFNGIGTINNGVGNVISDTPILVSPTSTTTYTLTVVDAAGISVTSTVIVTVNENVSNNLSLGSLELTSGVLDQAFQTNQLKYTAKVGFAVPFVKVTATTNNVDAIIKVNGVEVDENNTSQPITLSEGSSPPITIVVIENSVTKEYTLTITRQIGAEFAQQAYIKGASSDLSLSDFGRSIALSGNTLAVGAMFEMNMTDDDVALGAVYVFTRNGAIWEQQAHIKPSTDTSFFGSSVALEDDALVVGADGEVYIFSRNEGSWAKQATLNGSNADEDDGFGGSVALSGDTLVVGSEGEDSLAVGVNGDGSDNIANNSENNTGAAYVFTRSGSNWTQQAYLKASNTGLGDNFGRSVAIHGDTIVVGVAAEASAATGINSDETDNSVPYAGAAYVFSRAGDVWSQQAYLKADNPEDDPAFFGTSVAIYDDVIAIGAIQYGMNGADYYADFVVSPGAVYVYIRSGTSWLQQSHIKASSLGAVGFFGSSVALSGDTLVIGAKMESSAVTGVNGNVTDSFIPLTGAAYVFVRNGDVWLQDAYLQASNADENDVFGTSVAISEGRIAVGAIGEDSAATGVNGNQQDNSKDFSGAVYVFE